jgi:hypothetical protein
VRSSAAPREDDAGDSAPVAHECPHVAIEAAELALHREKRASVFHCASDLEPVADDIRVGEQPLDAPGVEARDPGRIETGRRLAMAVALPRIVDQLSPACAPSRIRNSKNTRSS